MKAAIYTQYGPPDVVSIQEIAVPVPKVNELLVKVMASTVNRTDCGFRSASYFISRFFSGLFKPRYHVLGCEFAGVVEAVGQQVTAYKPGDKITGFNDKKFGGHAEYLTVADSDAIALLPDGFEFENAAAITEGAHYALCNIRASKITAGQYAMVYGATGAIGTAAVQLLKHFGVNVTAVCNSKNVLLVSSLGADTVIDYATSDFTQTTQKFDVIFDAVGKSSFKQCKPLLTAKGKYISTELGKNSENIFLALLAPFSTGKKVLFPLPTISKKDVEFLCSLAASGEFVPVIDSVYPLDKIVDAYRYVETGQKTGNVIIKIAE